MDPVQKISRQAAVRRMAMVKKRTVAQRATASDAARAAVGGAENAGGCTLRALGHGGLLIRYAGNALLCDPWLGDGGAHIRSWHQFPPNDFLDRDELRSANFLYLSSRRSDHFDREFLATMPHDLVTVIVGDSLSNRFVHELTEIGFARIVKLPEGREYALANGFTIRLAHDPALHTFGTVALIRAGESNILDAADCRVAPADFARYRERGVDLFFAQHARAAWGPAAPDARDGAPSDSAARARRRHIDALVEAANGVEAAHVVASAGPPCFLDDAYDSNLGDGGTFVNAKAAIAEIARRVQGEHHVVHPGEEITLAPVRGGARRECRLAIAHGRAVALDLGRAEALLEDYRRRRAPAIRDALAALPPLPVGGVWQFRDFLRELFSANTAVRDAVDALVKFEITGTNGGAVFVDTRQRALKMSLVSPGRPSYEIAIDSRVARLLIEREETWEDLFLSKRYRARQAADFDNWPLFAILQYGHDAKLMRHVEAALRECGARSAALAGARAEAAAHKANEPGVENAELSEIR